MAYAYVVNDQILEIKYFLPRTWLNVSNFNQLTKEQLINLGWYPVIESHIELNPGDIITNTEYRLDPINKLVNKILTVKKNPRPINGAGILID